MVRYLLLVSLVACAPAEETPHFPPVNANDGCGGATAWMSPAEGVTSWETIE